MPDCNGLLDSIQDVVVLAKVHKALKLLQRTLDIYPPDTIAFSFNGGKDSTVLLQLARIVVQQRNLSTADGGLGGIHSFFFVHEDDFPEVLQFVKDMDARYNLGVEYIHDPDFKNGLTHYLQRTSVKAVLLGTRRGDPNATDQQEFCPSSENWPPFMRINPILDWAYSDVWAFLLNISSPFCCLYKEGYTSLGSRHNTLPNSFLKREDGTFCPAWALSDGRAERAGRVSKVESIEKMDSWRDELPKALTWRAGIIIVGDEILAGKVEDINVTFMCQQLRSIGWQVAKVVMVPDDASAIASEARAMSDAFEAVFTAGGVGPTLDDVTMRGLAQALGRPLIRNPVFEERLRAYFKGDITDAHLKMCETPDDEVQLLDYELDNGTTSAFPVVRCRNIFVLPGVPVLLRQKFKAIKAVLQQEVQLNPFLNTTFRLSVADETITAPALVQLNTEFGSWVAVGSYPVEEQADGAQLLLTLDSKHAKKLEESSDRLSELLPGGVLIGKESNSSTLLPSHRLSHALKSAS